MKKAYNVPQIMICGLAQNETISADVTISAGTEFFDEE